MAIHPTHRPASRNIVLPIKLDQALWDRLQRLGFEKIKENTSYMDVLIPKGWTSRTDERTDQCCFLDPERNERMFIRGDWLNTVQIYIQPRYEIVLEPDEGDSSLIYFVLDNKRKISPCSAKVFCAYSLPGKEQGIVNEGFFLSKPGKTVNEEEILFKKKRDVDSFPSVYLCRFENFVFSGNERDLFLGAIETELTKHLKDRLDELPDDGREWGDEYDRWFYA